MDAEAQHTERDRSSQPALPEENSDTAGAEERSRFALVARAADWLPGGRFSLTVLICLVFLLLLSQFVIQPFQIPSGSMEPGLRIGDRVLVNRLAYRFGAEPRRGDVVVFDGTGYFGDADYIKRVVGVGGDHVVCCDRQGRIEVNGRSVDESTFLYPGDEPSEASFDVLVPDGTLFVLGDHRGDSSDSRDHLGSPGGGMIPVGRVVGRADWIVWPAEHWTGVERAQAHARAADPSLPEYGGGEGALWTGSRPPLAATPGPVRSARGRFPANDAGAGPEGGPPRAAAERRAGHVRTGPVAAGPLPVHGPSTADGVHG
ncbi:signal peptidase I [Streptomyces fructofermentans]|uniref:Signal peptidase I n=1 Tax=Streptomyces fructofermentans TaxID=152141 RepID=A0A918KRG0_9ACTN|nr:signal peptidase I [Streptomyces fructofermentans]